MAEPWLILATGCALLQVSSNVNLGDRGLVETSNIVVENQGDCLKIELPLPSGVSVERFAGRQRNSDGTSWTIDPVQFEMTARGLSDESRLSLHLPALKKGDQAHLSIERSWPVTSEWTWSPGQPTEKASLKVGKALSIPGGSTRAVFKQPQEPVSLVVRGPNSDPVHTDFSVYAAPTRPVDVIQTIKLITPSGDPLISLYPGGGSTVDVTEEIRFTAELQERAYRVPMRANSGPIEWSVMPEGAARVVQRVDDAVILLPASEGPARVLLKYSAPDAPTYGEVPQRPNTHLTLNVRARDGRVQWEPNGKYWRLASIAGRPILPNRTTMIRALDARFRAASVPEPGLPLALRGRLPSWDLVGDVVHALNQQVVLTTWPSDALWPRPIYKARKTEVMTPTEASVTLERYLEQAGFNADLYLVRSTGVDTELATSPAGFDESLVKVVFDGEARWIDFACSTCELFELRPHLYSRPLLGPDDTKSPSIQPGRWSATMSDGMVTWRVLGPASFAFREALRTGELDALSSTLLGLTDCTAQTSPTPASPTELEVTIQCQTPIQNESLVSWLKQVAINTPRESPWLGPFGLRLPASTCEVADHLGQDWIFKNQGNHFTWALTAPLSPGSLTSLSDHLTATLAGPCE